MYQYFDKSAQVSNPGYLNRVSNTIDTALLHIYNLSFHLISFYKQDVSLPERILIESPFDLI